MMRTVACPHCGGEIQAQEGRRLRLCPYCGHTLEDGPLPDASPLEDRLKGETNPKKKYALIQEALARDPDDFFANRALLFHGRLHEPLRGSKVDFSIIKCHLLSVFERPDDYAPAQLDAKYGELLRGEQLLKTMALSGDPETFFAYYLRRLAREYVHLFIQGDSQYGRTAFGFSRTRSSAARRCAEPVRRMLREIAATPRLEDRARSVLLSGVREGFLSEFPDSQGLLDE